MLHKNDGQIFIVFLVTVEKIFLRVSPICHLYIMFLLTGLSSARILVLLYTEIESRIHPNINRKKLFRILCLNTWLYIYYIFIDSFSFFFLDFSKDFRVKVR